MWAKLHSLCSSTGEIMPKHLVFFCNTVWSQYKLDKSLNALKIAPYNFNLYDLDNSLHPCLFHPPVSSSLSVSPVLPIRSFSFRQNIIPLTLLFVNLLLAQQTTDLHSLISPVPHMQYIPQNQSLLTSNHLLLWPLRTQILRTQAPKQPLLT